MEIEFFLNSINPLITISLLALLLLLLSLLRRKPTGKTPPGPTGIPVLGNLLQLGDLPHESMHNWRGPHGPVLWLRLGSVGTLVVQSPTAAAELFKKHDLPFSDRRAPHAVTALDFGRGTLSMSRFGPRWRALRRLFSSEFLVGSRVAAGAGLRRRLRDDTVRWILEESAAGRAREETGYIQLGLPLFAMAFNLVGNVVLSRDLISDANDWESRQFFDCMRRAIELAGTPNLADYLPWLEWADPSGMRKEMEKNLGVTMRITARFVRERLDEREARKFREGDKDFLDVLLECDGMTEKDINIIITEMFFAASDTTSISIEWGFAELLRSPRTFVKVREELDRVVGVDRRVDEKDIENMPYLQAVVKEALRLHPVLPLLPRNTHMDTNYMGYHIPKDTQVFVNVWSIGRDPEVWPDPLEFRPERFLGSDIEYKGQHFELIPFGSGRRICVGLLLAHRMVHLAIASLVQLFDWDLGPGVRPEDIDREEKLGLTLRKKNPLFVIPTKRINC
ncbi:cytochrome P450- family 76- subfamily G-polypeptide 1 [Striga hermonthica]|uniref:Cytochrome P450- family 76- subfamily G-polypeptide 1 n=1 Tax=Striga hermonthica TaxID=68872 RepID=A0A9N7RA52_STRHE|nr:cytochrome P450- family 76- subfamily G-polypeptide 1 [Striga hermonthica]